MFNSRLFPINPHTAGSFDIFDELDKITKNAYQQDTFYPPYNIYSEGDKMFLEIAVTGFNKEDLKFYLDDSNNLVIEGKQVEKEESSERKYHTRKLSSKSFSKKFELPKNTDVGEVTVQNGLAIVEFRKIEPEFKYLQIK